MKSTKQIVLAILTGLVLFFDLPWISNAEARANLGWIEGVLISHRGHPVASNCYGNPNGHFRCNEAQITLLSADGNRIKTQSDIKKGGFYTYRNLNPGIYELIVDHTVMSVGGVWVHYRPQHIFGIVVEPGKRTRLNITVHRGSTLEEIGKPAITTEQAIIISDELAKLQLQIDELRNKLANSSNSPASSSGPTDSSDVTVENEMGDQSSEASEVLQEGIDNNNENESQLASDGNINTEPLNLDPDVSAQSDDSNPSITNDQKPTQVDTIKTTAQSLDEVEGLLAVQPGEIITGSFPNKLYFKFQLPEEKNADFKIFSRSDKFAVDYYVAILDQDGGKMTGILTNTREHIDWDIVKLRFTPEERLDFYIFRIAGTEEGDFKVKFNLR